MLMELGMLIITIISVEVDYDADKRSLYDSGRKFDKTQSVFLEFSREHILHRPTDWRWVLVCWLWGDTRTYAYDPSLKRFLIKPMCIQSTTEEAAKDIAAFISMFFETFPKFKGRAFHLSGESYAVSFYRLHTCYLTWPRLVFYM